MPTKASTEVRVEDVMTRNPICASMATTVRELAELLVENEISGVPVIDPQEHVVGVVSRTDLLDRCLQADTDGSGSFFVTLAEGLELDVDIDTDEMGTVEEFMSTDPVTVSPREPVTAVARRMARDRIHRVIVVDPKNRVIGIVTSLDALKELSR